MTHINFGSPKDPPVGRSRQVKAIDKVFFNRVGRGGFTKTRRKEVKASSAGSLCSREDRRVLDDDERERLGCPSRFEFGDPVVHVGKGGKRSGLVIRDVVIGLSDGFLSDVVVSHECKIQIYFPESSSMAWCGVSQTHRSPSGRLAAKFRRNRPVFDEGPDYKFCLNDLVIIRMASGTSLGFVAERFRIPTWPVRNVYYLVYSSSKTLHLLEEDCNWSDFESHKAWFEERILDLCVVPVSDQVRFEGDKRIIELPHSPRGPAGYDGTGFYEK